MEEWLYGWKAIAERCSVTVKTAKKYHNKYGMTVRRGPKNKPIALPHELDQWLINFDEIKRKLKG